MVNKNTLGVKRHEDNQKQWQAQLKVLISAEAKKLLYQKYFLYKRWPSDKANHEKYDINYILYVIQGVRKYF